MLRRLAFTILALAAGFAPAAAQMPAPSHARVHALEHATLMSGAPIDSAQCATLHAALQQHFADLQLDSTQMLALHTMLLAHAGVVQLDSTQLASIHGTLQQAMANGALDDTHVALFRTIVSDSTHLAAIRACFAEHAGGASAQTSHRH
ncbi:MAG TPA: hypothetical protein VN706_18140 [Gemmatimonadaceae bacterium]|nr:hypothetical protein [Gemmatimonadaceae bacterium]